MPDPLFLVALVIYLWPLLVQVVFEALTAVIGLGIALSWIRWANWASRPLPPEPLSKFLK